MEFWECDRCQIDVSVTLPHSEFEDFRRNTLRDHDFIANSLSDLATTNDNTRHCIMVLDEEADDGIIVDPQGYNYARYSAYISNAKQLMQTQYPSLDDFNERMRRAVDKYVNLALENHDNGKYSFDIEDVNSHYDCENFNSDLFVDMIGERVEFSDVEYYGGEFTVTLANNFRNDKKRELSQRDVNVICAQHILWLNDAGGEKADFSHCVLRGLDLNGKDLTKSDCSNAVFDECDLKSVDFSSAEVESAVFRNCNMQNAFAKNTNFIQAEFIECDMSNSNISGSLLISTVMRKCEVEDILITACQIDEFEYPDTEMDKAFCFDEESNKQEGFMTLS